MFKTFRQWIESYDDEFSIEGEYWITDDGDVMYADGDIGDMNHEAYVIELLQTQIADAIGFNYGDHPDWEQVARYLTRFGAKLPKFLAQHGISQEELNVANGTGDAREYAIEKLGWKRVQDHNIETWTLNKKDAAAILAGLEDIAQDVPDDEQFKNIEVYIYCYSNRQNHEFTIGQLEELVNPKPQPMQQTRFNTTIDLQNQAAKQHQIDQDKLNMPDYYKQKKYPFADWKLNR